MTAARILVHRLVSTLMGNKRPQTVLETYEIIWIADDTLRLKYTGTGELPPAEYVLKRIGP
jgi:hypothetical protein